jgi:cathepsin L
LTAPQGYTARPDVAAVRKKVKDKGYTFIVGENPATQYSLEQLCGTKMPAVRRPRMKTASAPQRQAAAAGSLPSSFDWRKLEGCTPIKNQGGCGSCWAFAAMGVVECVYRIRGNEVRDFSEQWLVSCTEAGDCDGGWYETALDYLLNRQDACDKIGSPLEEDYPYEAQNADCTCPAGLRFVIMDWSAVQENIEAIKEAIYTYGPVAVCVHSDDLFQCYLSGIFNASSSNGNLNHAVVLVGWDDTQGANGIWILRNSWGTGWGENGYMRIEYGSNNVGAAPCYAEWTPENEPNYFDVPDVYPTLKAAFAAANNNDIIRLAPGTYTGNDNTNIDFGGKGVTLRSTNPLDPNTVAATIIDCQGTDAVPRRAFIFDKGENANSVISGLTIRNGYIRDNGGAVYCYYSSPTIKNCVFENNTATGYKKAGGAIALYNSNATITNCLITNNFASGYGGGISCRDGSMPVISNCQVLDNYSSDEGGGIYCWVNSNAQIDHTIIAGNYSNNAGGGLFFFESGDSVDPNVPTLTFCTITANSTDGLGGGIFIMDSFADMNNSIVWENTADIFSGPQIAMLDDSLNGTTLQVNYCDVTGLNLGHVVEENCILEWGLGNINLDPLFADPLMHDYHLKSASGHWNPETSEWILDDGDNFDAGDDENSPCIDAGDPALPVGMEMQCNGNRINIGADGGTEQASRSPAEKCCMQCIEGDFNCDCIINMEDLMRLAASWLQCNLLPRYHCAE